MSGGLHIHELHAVHGNLVATLADSGGRHLSLEFDPDDHPALRDAWVKFCEAITAASSSVMLDLLDLAGTSIEVPEPERTFSTVPCRLCGDAVLVDPFSEEDRVEVFAHTYCPKCTAERAAHDT